MWSVLRTGGPNHIGGDITPSGTSMEDASVFWGSPKRKWAANPTAEWAGFQLP